MEFSSRLRRLAQAGTAVAFAAALLVTTGPAASAAPSGFDVQVHHSTGALVARLQGNLSWSSSLKTVTFSAQALYVKAGECVDGTAAGYQGNNRVTDPYEIHQCGEYSGNPAPLSLTANVPGGVQRVVIRLTDRVHGNMRYDNCIQTASACSKG